MNFFFHHPFVVVVAALFSSGLCADFHRLAVVGKIPSEHIKSKSNDKFCDGSYNSSIKIRTLLLHVCPVKSPSLPGLCAYHSVAVR